MHTGKSEENGEASSEVTLTPTSAQQTLQWITVLSAKRLDYRLSQEQGRWLLHVPTQQARTAEMEIAAFEEDEAARFTPTPAPLAQPSRKTIQIAHWTGFWCAYVLVLCHVSLGAFDAANALHTAAAMSRNALLQGEWWRGITALTLHSGFTHLLANTIFLLFVGQAVIRELGRGLGPALILAGGVLGNYLAAYTASPYQRSVGASTACFAALGILSTLQAARHYRRYRSWNRVWRQAWIPIAAGIALLGLTGTSPGSDIGAHLFGFLAGICLALAPAIAQRHLPRISPGMQWALAALSALLLALAWALAAVNA